MLRKTILRITIDRNGVPYFLLILGLVALFSSVFFSSYFQAFVGLGLTFWGALFLFVKPGKFMKLELLGPISISALVNIEEMLTEVETGSTGIYLPPNRLKDCTSSLVFIPTGSNQPLPTTKERQNKTLKIRNPPGFLITPPGLGLSRFFEKELKRQFNEMTLEHLQIQLPKLFDGLQITKHMDIRLEENKITVVMINHIFEKLCKEAAKLEKTHKTVGCHLSSALACAFAKATGKPIIIVAEETSPDATTTIRFQVLEDQQLAVSV
jgi:hypothetical protein